MNHVLVMVFIAVTLLTGCILVPPGHGPHGHYGSYGGPGNSDRAPGHDQHGPGNSENAPGHNKHNRD
ncbi:MAG: hypothetical protein ACXW11_08210 [Methylotenera sp.]